MPTFFAHAQAIGRLEGRWITCDEMEFTIEGEKIMWEDGDVWTIEAAALGGGSRCIGMAAVRARAFQVEEPRQHSETPGGRDCSRLTVHAVNRIRAIAP